MPPVFLPPDAPLWFPDASEADDDGLVAAGADLSLPRLRLAYDSGLFPWYEERLPPLWWSPDPRAVIPTGGVHVSRRLARRLRQGRFRLTWDRAFERVMRACGERRDGGTWVIEEMVDAYVALHREGHAHSLEVWDGEELIGGVYGVHRGGLFAAESMFHRRTDGSKIALVACVRTVERAGIEIFDVQLPTPHLESMGAVEWSRERYLDELASVVTRQVDLEGLEPTWEAP